jgi:hypothetical protein
VFSKYWTCERTVLQTDKTGEFSLIFGFTSVFKPPFPRPFHALPPDVQTRPRCRNDRIFGYDYHDLHLSLCNPQLNSLHQ